MSSQNKDITKSKDKQKQSYRIIIRNDHDLKEINSFKLSLSKIYFLVFSVFLIISTLIISLIAFTPAKRLIPGYADINNNRVFVELNNEMNELEKKIEEQNTVTESLKKIIFHSKNKNSGEGEDSLSIPRTTSMIMPEENNDNSIPLLFTPVKGKLSMGYLLKKDHYGIDIICSKNSEVQAVHSGVILNTVWDPMTGNTISIQHPNNIVSIYKHNATLLKKIGDHVHAGEAIAIVGNTGEQSSGPHLHFELWINGQPVNPEILIDF